MFIYDCICILVKFWGRLIFLENKLIILIYLGDNKVKKEIEEFSGEDEIVNELV